MDAPDSHHHHRARRFWMVASLVAVVFRLLLIPLSPRYGYLFDHDDFVRWGIQAVDDGVLTLYDRPPPRRNLRCRHEDRWVITQRPLDRVCNYPPGAVYLLYASGLAFRAVSPDRLINTAVSRALFSCWGIVADFLLAGGCAALVAMYARGRAARWTYLVVLFAPPFWWDSALWGQFDTLLLAAGVWMIWALSRRRWWLAGALFGLAAGFKPQAVLFLPVWVLVMMAVKPRVKPLLALVLAAAAVLIVALPFTLHSGWAWWRMSYVNNLLEAHRATTLNAFNLWYVDLLICDSTDVATRWFGVSKDAWGRLLLLLGLGGGLVWMTRRWRGDARGLVLWCALALLACVMLPTRVHERYLLLVLPFLVVAAMWWRRFWQGLALLLLLVVATCQMTWPLWLTEPAGGWDDHVTAATRRYAQARAALGPKQRAIVPEMAQHLELEQRKYLEGRSKTKALEGVITVLALFGAATTVWAALSLKPVDERE